MSRTVISSATREVVIGDDQPFVVIGERINPTGRKLLAEEMKQGDFSRVERDTIAQVEAGANISAWVRRLRSKGFEPEIVIGVPGVADPQKLINVAARIGVKHAKRFFVKNLRFVTGMARSGGSYKPTRFVEDIAPLLADPAAKVTGFHLYTFNAVEATEGWRQSMLGS